ncbi:hypothetical protein M413DRAFT_444498, partial [Hebeloma cylindrosporum]
MSLPQELIDCIIDELGSSEGGSDPECREALKACSLTSSSFLATSRKHLFAKVRLEESKNKQDLQRSLDLARLLEVLVEDNRISSTGDSIPPLASYIRSLSILLSPIRACENKRQRKRKLDPNPSSDIPAILEILIASSPISSFSLEFIGGTVRDWQYVDESLKAGVESLCRLPSTTTVHCILLEGFPTTLIASCPNLKALSLNAIRLPATSSPGYFPHLGSLVLHSHRPIELLEPLACFGPSSLPSLRHIEFPVGAWAGMIFPRAQELEILKWSPSLQSIKAKVSCDDIENINSGFPIDVDLSLLPALRSLWL